MTTIRRCRDRSLTDAPLSLFDDARLSLSAIGLYGWLGDDARTVEAAMTRFGLNRSQLTPVLVELREAGFIEVLP